MNEENPFCCPCHLFPSFLRFSQLASATSRAGAHWHWLVSASLLTNFFADFSTAQLLFHYFVVCLLDAWCTQLSAQLLHSALHSLCRLINHLTAEQLSSTFFSSTLLAHLAGTLISSHLISTHQLSDHRSGCSHSLTVCLSDSVASLLTVFSLSHLLFSFCALCDRQRIRIEHQQLLLLLPVTTITVWYDCNYCPRTHTHLATCQSLQCHLPVVSVGLSLSLCVTLFPFLVLSHRNLSPVCLSVHQQHHCATLALRILFFLYFPYFPLYSLFSLFPLISSAAAAPFCILQSVSLTDGSDRSTVCTECLEHDGRLVATSIASPQPSACQSSWFVFCAFFILFIRSYLESPIGHSHSLSPHHFCHQADVVVVVVAEVELTIVHFVYSFLLFSRLYKVADFSPFSLSPSPLTISESCRKCKCLGQW